MSDREDDYFCPAPVSVLNTGDGVACDRLVNANGQYCLEHQGQGLVDLLLNGEYVDLYQRSASFHQGVDLLVRVILPATLKGLALESAAQDAQRRVQESLARVRPPRIEGPYGQGWIEPR